MAPMKRKLFRKSSKRGTSGSVAVEFALIAPLFLLLLFGMIETALATFAGMMLENGMKTVARLVRTGQAQGTNMTQTQFRTALCNQVSVVLSCDQTRLYIDVRAFTNFAGSSFPQPIDANGNINPNLNAYQLGQSSQNAGGTSIVLVRA